MASEERKIRVHWAVKLFVLVHVVLVFTWSMPNLTGEKNDAFLAQPIEEQIKQPIDMWVVYNHIHVKNSSTVTSPYLISTGLWQSWNMFAPNPSDTDVYIEATIKYEDGTEEIRSFYRIYDMPIPQKYVFERYRKYREYLSDDYYRWKWPQTAMRMALEARRETGKEPELVVLTRYWNRTESPDEEQSDEYNAYDFYRRYVTDEELDAFEEGTWTG